MNAVFSASGPTCLLLSSWHVDSDGAQWLLVVLGVWLLAFLREGLTVYRAWAVVARRHEDMQRKTGTTGATATAAGAHTASPHMVMDHADSSAIALQSSSSFHTLKQPLVTRGMLASDEALADPPTRTATAVDLSSASASVSVQSEPAASESSPRAGAAGSIVTLPSSWWWSALRSAEVSDSLYYVLSLTFGYLLMLLIMTYNVWVCLLVLSGCGGWHLILHALLNHRWKPALMRTTKEAIKQQQQQQQQTAARTRAPSVGVADGAALRALDVRAAPVSGEHCCDDLVFDD